MQPYCVVSQPSFMPPSGRHIMEGTQKEDLAQYRPLQDETRCQARLPTHACQESQRWKAGTVGTGEVAGDLDAAGPHRVDDRHIKGQHLDSQGVSTLHHLQAGKADTWQAGRHLPWRLG